MAATVPHDYTRSRWHRQTIPAGTRATRSSCVVNGDETAEPDETFFVNVTSGVGQLSSTTRASVTIANDDAADHARSAPFRAAAPAAAAGTFTVEAIVVGDYQAQGSGRLRGFFVQEEDADADADPATSEGIFVFCTTCPVAVNVGDKVRVTGTSSEFFDMWQLTATGAAAFP